MKNENYLVLTGFDDNMATVGNLTKSNQRSYALRHGYEFEVLKDYKRSSHPSWQKLENLLTRLGNYKGILWLDADTLITNQDIQIEDITGGKSGMFFSLDWEPNLPSDKFSAGNFVVTNSPESFELLNAASTKNQYSNSNQWEQSAFQDVYREGVLTNKFTILPRRMLNSVPSDVQPRACEPWQIGDFLCHLTGINNERRLALFRKYDLAGISHRLGKLCNGHETTMMVDLRHIATIIEILKQVKLDSVLEIGVWKGATTKAFVECLVNGDIKNLSCCDPNFQKEFLDVIAGHDVNLLQGNSLDVLKMKEKFDVIFVDGDHTYGHGVKETRLLMQQEPKLIIGHDVAAEISGFGGCGGPSWMHHELQNNGWYCVIDQYSRKPQEATHRGILFATKDKKILDIILRCMPIFCY